MLLIPDAPGWGKTWLENPAASRALESAIGAFSEADWRRAAPYAAGQCTDLGGMIEGILALPPRPLYRHLPVHVADARAYIRSLR